MKKTIVEGGLVAERGGKYWGVLYEDGRSCTRGFGPIEKATIADPKYARVPEDMVYSRSPDRRELKKAKFKRVSKTTVFKVE